jgi:hypothetical protein
MEQAALHFAAFRDVHHRALVANDLPAIVANGRSGVQADDRSAVLADEGNFLALNPVLAIE